MHSYNLPPVQNNTAIIPAAAPIASPVSTLNPTTAAPLVRAGAALVVEPELPLDVVETGEVAVPVVPLLILEPDVAPLEAPVGAEDTVDWTDDGADVT
jgi:hypothetical protein